VGAGVESISSLRLAQLPAPQELRLRVRLLGALEIRRGSAGVGAGIALALPASRKVRALLARLALASRPLARETLCDLLWDRPNDPRGELRWCLSKIRALVDDASHRRLRAEGDAVRLDLSDVFVDALEIERALCGGLAALGLAQLQSLAALYEGDFLQGLVLARTPAFDAWLAAQRRRFREANVRLLEQLAARAPGIEAVPWLEQWLALEPFELRAHWRMLEALLQAGRLREAQAQFAIALRGFEEAGLDRGPLHEAWRAIRASAAHDDGRTAANAGSVGVTESVDLVPLPCEALGAGAPKLLPVGDAEASKRETGGSCPARRASIAVMPFAAQGDDARIGIALAHDVVTRLAKLRSLFVIGQGSVSALHARGVDAQQAARLLRVDYSCSGTLRREGAVATIEVELVESATAHVVWAERFELADTFGVLDEIGNRIVASLAAEIEALERNRAILLPPGSLDAWSAHHRGLWHMYRFDPPDNAKAQHFFETAVRLDPTFSRAWAGLSFTHFQNAFQGWTTREPETQRAIDAAAQALMADDRDPSAHWAMGRALWLREGHDASVGELEQAVELSPNFALGHYTLAFVHSQSGDPRAAIAASDHARLLSPFDPLLFGMLGSHAIALVRLDRVDEAAHWAVRAAARPNAHPHIHAIAAFTLGLAGSLDEARRHAVIIRGVVPGYGFDDFAAAFRFDVEASRRFREGARRIGM